MKRIYGCAAVLALLMANPSKADDFVDFQKRLWVKKGVIVCADLDDLKLANRDRRAMESSDCITMPMAMEVLELEGSGLFYYYHRVRILGMGDKRVEAWLTTSSLTNHPSEESLTPDLD